jgi:hypothetical protein
MIDHEENIQRDKDAAEEAERLRLLQEKLRLEEEERKRL